MLLIQAPEIELKIAEKARILTKANLSKNTSDIVFRCGITGKQLARLGSFD
jgi:hypothetical protein